MLKVAKYLKPYIIMILIAVALLFAQSLSDLSLPDYMSQIVNIGIQQGGVEDSIPQAVRQSQMDRLKLFMTEDEQKMVDDNFALIDKTNKDYNKYKKLYPLLDSEDVLVFSPKDDLDRNKLNLLMGKAFVMVSGIEKAMEGTLDKNLTMEGLAIPPGTDLFEMFAMMPAEQRLNITREMDKQLEALGEGMLGQISASAVKAEYIKIGMDIGSLQNRYIIKTGFFMLLLSLLSAACTVGVGYLSARISSGFGRDLRRNVFAKVESFSNAEMDKFSTASLITRTTNDVTQVQMMTNMMFRMVISAPIMGVGGVIKALGKSTSMSWIIALAVIVLSGMILVMFTLSMPRFKIMQKLVDRVNLVTRENLTGLMVIRAFNTQKFEEKRFDDANRQLTRNQLFVNRVMQGMMPTITLIMNGTTLLIIWVGAHKIAESGMQVGDMMAFMQYAIQIIFAFLTLSMLFVMMPRASVSAQRIAEVLDTKLEITDPENPKMLEDKDNETSGVVEFDNVSFRYSNAEEDVLKNISFKALPGQTTAFIGSTGSGKTTLVNLIPRFYDVTEGRILIDGIDIRELSQQDLRDMIGYIPQKASLFSGTIESNLKYANENASVEEMQEAAEIAQAMEFIVEEPDGFSREIAQGGANVSGGQKQRLSIARALLKKPRIFIFDDSFSALDFKTDSLLRKELKAHTGASTVLIVAQRISTIRNAEQIIVLNNGRMVGIGTHSHLMETCETYREIALSQLSKEELA
jgi:ATP-binding cassette subfamily B multidrug efflux pump